VFVFYNFTILQNVAKEGCLRN